MLEKLNTEWYDVYENSQKEEKLNATEMLDWDGLILRTQFLMAKGLELIAEQHQSSGSDDDEHLATKWVDFLQKLHDASVQKKGGYTCFPYRAVLFDANICVRTLYQRVESRIATMKKIMGGKEHFSDYVPTGQRKKGNPPVVESLNIPQYLKGRTFEEIRNSLLKKEVMERTRALHEEVEKSKKRSSTDLSLKGGAQPERESTNIHRKEQES